MENTITQHNCHNRDMARGVFGPEFAPAPPLKAKKIMKKLTIRGRDRVGQA